MARRSTTFDPAHQDLWEAISFLRWCVVVLAVALVVTAVAGLL